MGIESQNSDEQVVKILTSPTDAYEMVLRQIKEWPLAAKNYADLSHCETKMVQIEGAWVRVQYNPNRIISTGAKVDPASIEKRKCFLCTENLPAKQERLDFKDKYWVLCNPYPIFREHLTIACKEHVKQDFLPHFDSFLELTKTLDIYSVFYNGPQSGASAPDHLHFQAASTGSMTLDDIVQQVPLCHQPAKVMTFNASFRNGYLIGGSDKKMLKIYVERLMSTFIKEEDEWEPKMNVFCYYRNNEWLIVLIPRRQHRPWQYSAYDEDCFLSSPGAADIGGLFVTPRKEDYDRADADVLMDIYGQVCYSKEELDRFSKKL